MIIYIKWGQMRYLLHYAQSRRHIKGPETDIFILMRQEGLLQKKEQVLDPATQRFSEEYTPLETKKVYKRNHKFLTGFTLFELALAAALFGVAAVGNLSLYISCATLTESAGNITRMMNRAREELEGVVFRRNFVTLSSYPVVSPEPLAPPEDREMSLVCYVQDHPTVIDIKEVRIVISYREKSNRIIGEDRNLNGVLNIGEDTDGDGRLTSPCEILTFITRKE